MELTTRSGSGVQYTGTTGERPVEEVGFGRSKSKGWPLAGSGGRFVSMTQPTETAGLRTTLRSLLLLFSPRERRRLWGVVVLSVVVALLQAFSIASVIPFLSLVANPDFIQETPWLESIYAGLGFQSVSRFLFFVGGAVLVILAVTNVLSALATWVTFRFVWNQHHRMSTGLLREYLHRPYTYFLNRNTSEMAKKLLQEVQFVTDGAAMQLVMLIADVAVVLGILLLLLVVDWRLSLVIMGTLGGAYVLVFALVRRTQTRLGEARNESNTERFRFASEALVGIKNVIVMGRQEAFLSRFEAPSRVYSDNIRDGYLIGLMPRFVMETLAFGGVLVIVLYLLAQGGDSGDLIAGMGLYAFAGYKLMPALQHAFHAITQLQFYHPVVRELNTDFGWAAERIRVEEGMAGSAAESPTSEVINEDWQSLKVKDVFYTYPEASEATIRGVTLDVARNSWVAFVGTTGSGKTTMIDLLLGLLPPDSGEIALDDRPLAGQAVDLWRQRCGYVPQDVFLTDESLAGNIAFGIPPDERDEEAIRLAAEIAHLSDVVGSLDQGFDSASGERGVRLSGGQRQRIGIARALYGAPDVLILDEATSAVDSVTEEAILKGIGALSGKMTLIMIAHRISTLKSCDQIFLMEHGGLAARGTYDELIESEPRFRALAKEWDTPAPER